MIKNFLQLLAIIATITTIAGSFVSLVDKDFSVNANDNVSTMSLGDIEPPIVKD